MYLLFTLMGLFYLAACSSLSSKPYSNEYPDKVDLVVDRADLSNQIQKNPGNLYLKFLPVEIASESSKAQDFNRSFQQSVTSACQHSKKDKNADKIYSDEELVQEVDSSLAKIPSNLKTSFLSRARSSEGQTLLLCSSMNDRPILTEYLLKNGADKNVQSYFGDTPVSYAKSYAGIGTQQALSFDNRGINSLSDIYRRYCSSSILKRNMIERIKAVMPIPSPGLSLDAAQAFIQKNRTAARIFAKELFVIERPLDIKRRKFLGLTNAEDVLSRNDLDKYGFGSITYQSQGKNLSPQLSNLKNWSDLDLIRHSYTFNFPKEFQESAFKVEKLTDPYTVSFSCANGHEQSNDSFHHDGFLGLDENCNFSTEQAIGDRQRAWFNFAHRFTTVKEALSDNPSELKFEITLDLENFCKYGVAISDLKSK